MRAVDVLMRRRGVPLPQAPGQLAHHRKGIGFATSGGAISQWADQSGNARHLVQPTGANQPQLNGGNALFDGSNDFMYVAYAAALPRTRYLRLRRLSWVFNSAIVSGQTANTGLVLSHPAAPPNITLYNGGYGPANALLVGSWASVAIVVDGAASVLQVGSSTTVGPSPNTGAINGTVLGANGSGGAQPAYIEVAEHIDYAGAHDAAQRAAFIAYLDAL